MAEEQKDWYALLGVERTATTKEITKAYRLKALKYHPDKNPDPNAGKMFHDLSQAYDVLLDAGARAAFDNLLNVKLQAKERTERFDSTRRKMKEDLERRENEFKQQQQAEKEAALKMRYETERLKQERIKKQAEREAELLREADQMSEAAEAARKAAIEKESKSLDTTLRIKWNKKKHSFETDTLSNIFKKYGEVDKCLSKKPGSAVISFHSIQGAYAAMKAADKQDKDLEPFTVSWAAGEEPAIVASVRSNISSTSSTNTTSTTSKSATSIPPARTHLTHSQAFNVSADAPYVPKFSAPAFGGEGVPSFGFSPQVPSFGAPSTFLDDYETATLAKLKNRENERKRLAEEMMKQDQEEEEEEEKEKKQKV